MDDQLAVHLQSSNWNALLDLSENIEDNGNPSESARRSVYGAWACLKLELYRRGLRLSEQALKYEPGMVDALVIRAGLLAALRRDARDAAEAAIEQSYNPGCELLVRLSLKELLTSEEVGKLGKSRQSADEAVTIPQTTLLSDQEPNLTKEKKKKEPVDSSIAVTPEKNEQAKLLALAVQAVNASEHDMAQQIFDSILLKDPKSVMAYVGRGTSYAMCGHLDRAIADLSDALNLNPQETDAYLRRSQCYVAQGSLEAGLRDLNRAIQHGADALSARGSRGILQNKRMAFREAREDLEWVYKLQPSAEIAAALGMSILGLGKVQDSLEFFSTVSKTYVGNRGILLAYGQAYKEMGDAEGAQKKLQEVLELEPSSANALYLSGLIHFQNGEHRNAEARMAEALKMDENYSEALWMLGVVRIGCMRYGSANEVFTRLLESSPKHVAWYYRHINSVLEAKQSMKFLEWDMESSFDDIFRERWCKRLDPSSHPLYAQNQPYKPEDAIGQFEPSERADLMQRYASQCINIGKLLQYNCAGYMRNRRQWLACGIAAIELAQNLRKYYRNATADDRTAELHRSTSAVWRRLMEGVVRWRQISELNDPVLWVDKLSFSQFSDGFGSHTPMITGQTAVVRYSPMAPRAIAIMRDLIIQQSASEDRPLPSGFAESVSMERLHAAMGGDFWVTTPCHSTARPGAVMEGTRLTIQSKAPGGFEFSIRTPGTPGRWTDYAIELEAAFVAMRDLVRQNTASRQQLVSASLQIVFYWYNFMPLSRGTAAVGFTTLLGLLLSIGLQPSEGIPPGVQVDWEGILSPTVALFDSSISSWLTPQLQNAAWFETFPLVADILPTVGEVCRFLQLS